MIISKGVKNTEISPSFMRQVLIIATINIIAASTTTARIAATTPPLRLGPPASDRCSEVIAVAVINMYCVYKYRDNY